MISQSKVFLHQNIAKPLAGADLIRGLITDHDTIVIKPNFLAGINRLKGHDCSSVITDFNVITLILELIVSNIHHGRILIVDGPQTDSAWNLILKNLPVDKWQHLGRKTGNSIELIDLREEEWVSNNDVIISKRNLPGDPLGSVVFDLGDNSEFVNHLKSEKGYYGADYNKKETNWAHSDGRHIYRISRTVLEANVFINMPKLKTHKKAGITCSLKNLVGINTYKNYLPHHNEGTPEEGGDQFPLANFKNSAESIILPRFKKMLASFPGQGKAFIPIKTIGRKVFGDTQSTIRSGNWYGNDTLWRMVLDLNKILYYGNPDGTLRAPELGNMKKYFSIVDGIIAGEGNGPEAPSPVNAGLLIYGANPVAVDAVCAKIMGFDWQKIPTIRNAFDILRYRICDFSYDDIEVSSIISNWNKPLRNINKADVFHFHPHFGWKDHIELT